MIILTIFSLILLYKMHDKDSKASYTIKTFGFLDLICSWGLIFFEMELQNFQLLLFLSF